MWDTPAIIHRWTDRLNQTVVSHSKAVVVVFLVLTVLFAGGMTAVDTEEEATDAFIEDLPEYDAFEAINEEFEDPFAADRETTQLIQVGNDVLAREELRRNLAVLERVENRDDLRMAGATGPATMVAQSIDPTAQTIPEQKRAIERASESEIRRAIAELAAQPGFENILSQDFNPTAGTASASVTVITHDVPREFDNDDVAAMQTDIRAIAADQPGDIRAFGGGIINDEFGAIIGDSLAIVIPVVIVLLLTFLVFAYRDPIDLTLGLVALFMTIIWTFGFLGFTGIPFDQQMIAVPVLLLAVGVDFGIHIINRYREETVQGYEPITAMRAASNQLTVAFVIVTMTAVFGFGANVISDLEPTRNFGIVASVGIVYTFLIFGLFLPALKLEVDTLRDQFGVPEFNSTPIASEGSALGRMLSVSAAVGQRAPVAFVVILLLMGAGMGAYGTGVDSTFDQEDFLPPEEAAWYVEYIPEPFAPGEYTVTETLNLLEDRFEADQDATISMYVEGPFEEEHALQSLVAPDDDPPDSMAVGVGHSADAESIVTVIQSYAEQDPEFAALVARNDRSGDGIPDRNLDRIYDELFASPAAGQAERFLTDDRRAAQIEYAVDAEAEQHEIAADGAAHAEEFRYDATATGFVIIFDRVTEIIYETAIQGAIIAITLSSLFLIVAYALLERRPLLGIVNVFPIAIAVAFLIGTMRLIGIPLNALTAMILAIAIGLGIAYSVHITARFIDEYANGKDTRPALETTLTGTGGALTGSMLTTSIGTGALALAITPVLGDFGLVIALAVFYSFVGAIVALPPALFIWADVTESNDWARFGA